MSETRDLRAVTHGRLTRAVPVLCAATMLAACQTGIAPAAAPAPAVGEVKGGPKEALDSCAFKAGIGGTYETEIFYDDGVELVSVVPGLNVNDDQADKANACLEAAA